jgi:predicted 3-demethylubiquinone-9 3-methyltransferase (glyoxalase superfamily)
VAVGRGFPSSFTVKSAAFSPRAPSGHPSRQAGDVLTVDGGPAFKHSEASSFQIATDTQEETDRYCAP